MSEILNAVNRYTYAFAIWTDKADFFIKDKTAPLDEARLLEIRCFDESGEYFARRDGVDGTFTAREITNDKSQKGETVFWEEAQEGQESYVLNKTIGTDDSEVCADGSFDEAQYLDIDTKRSGNGLTYTTGGGMYHLPEDAANKALILVRTYYAFDDNGIARKFDWRLVKFTNEETVGKE